MQDLDESPQLGRGWSIAAGVFVGFFGLVLLLVGVALGFNPHLDRNVQLFLGIPTAIASLWLLALAARLLSGRGREQGLISPAAWTILAVLVGVGGMAASVAAVFGQSNGLDRWESAKAFVVSAGLFVMFLSAARSQRKKRAELRARVDRPTQPT